MVSLAKVIRDSFAANRYCWSTVSIGRLTVFSPLDRIERLSHRILRRYVIEVVRDVLEHHVLVDALVFLPLAAGLQPEDRGGDRCRAAFCVGRLLEQARGHLGVGPQLRAVELLAEMLPQRVAAD